MLEGPQKDLLLFYNTDGLGIDGQSHAAVQSASETYVLDQHILGAAYETWSVISSIWYRALQAGGVIPGDYTHPTAMPIAARVEMIAIEAMGADYVVELDNCNNCSMYF